MAHRFTYPVRVLRAQITALEAALSVCLAEATPRAVHRLRTHTRRLEAQLLLLERLPAAPPHAPAAATLRRQLKRLRRAAGAVRDLDVHHARLGELLAAAAAGTVANESTASSGGSPATVEGVLVAAGKLSEPGLHEGTRQLDHKLVHKRDKAAARLGKLLRKHQAGTAVAAETMFAALRGAGHLRVSAEELLTVVEEVFCRDALLGAADPRHLHEEQLHDLRKSAKAARYLAETLPGHPRARAAAERLEALQGAGGQWHDALEMARAARHTLGRHHALSEALAAERSRLLRSYRAALRAALRAAAPNTAAPNTAVPAAGEQPPG